MVRENFISMRISKEEKELIRKSASAVGLTMSSYCKYLVLNLIKEKKREGNSQ